MRHETTATKAKMLRIYVGEDARFEGKPLYEAIVGRLRALDIAGATVYRGIAGFGAGERVRTTGRFGFSHDMPMMITIVEREEKIRRLLPVLDEMVDEGLLVLSDVDVIKYSHASPSDPDFSLSPERALRR